MLAVGAHAVYRDYANNNLDIGAYGNAVSHASYVTPVVNKIGYGYQPQVYATYGGYGHDLSDHDSYVSTYWENLFFVPQNYVLIFILGPTKVRL